MLFGGGVASLADDPKALERLGIKKKPKKPRPVKPRGPTAAELEAARKKAEYDATYEEVDSEEEVDPVTGETRVKRMCVCVWRWRVGGKARESGLWEQEGEDVLLCALI